MMAVNVSRRIRLAGVVACAGLLLSVVPARAASAGAAEPLAGAEAPAVAAEAPEPNAAPEAAAAAEPQEGGDLTAPAVRWEALKTRLHARGVTVGANYITDVTRLPGTSQAIGRGLTNASLSLDLEQMAGMKGTTAYVSHLWKGGANGIERLPLAQAFSNIDETSFQKVYEVWVEKRFSAVPARVKVGRVDANTEFAHVDAASDFINASMGFSPTIFLMPTYPNPTPSVNVFVDPFKQHLHAGVGFYQAREGTSRWQHPFTIGQIGASWNIGEGYDGQVTVGAWRQTLAAEEGFGTHRGTFATAEQVVWQSAPGAEATRSMKLFGQFGSTNSLEADMSRHIGAGASWTGLLKSRADDVFGVGLTAVKMSAAAEFAGHSETSFGPYYRMKIVDGLVAGPDVQFVHHAGGDATAGTKAVVTLRMVAEF